MANVKFKLTHYQREPLVRQRTDSSRGELASLLDRKRGHALHFLQCRESTSAFATKVRIGGAMRV